MIIWNKNHTDADINYIGIETWSEKFILEGTTKGDYTGQYILRYFYYTIEVAPIHVPDDCTDYIDEPNAVDDFNRGWHMEHIKK